ncbi:MAG TPA: DNA polymerase III subunit gamma/tau [Syntrophomonadaceae bacterium]|nr:DNA polymerase III subunit gamma/tau [Syntrophomonadaceae bacterium]
MSYLALYRAWRPRRFEEVVGQEQTVTALSNAIKENRLAHAYLFSGPRGTGKTSIAKIIAKAVNCENLQDGEPCNICSSCSDIDNGNFMDVVEIDAASNRGIDEIRDLREKVRILPAQGKFKVYIIDEVHMLTTEAFNALLKTIEEPPDSVIFILATTELQKIPATIRSRCQSYNFRRLTNEEIETRLDKVANSNDIVIEAGALPIIARRANGGLRDALSILDQLFSYKGQQISKKDVFDILGIVDQLFLSHLMDMIIDQDTSKIIELLSTALSEGKEAQQIAREMSLYLRDLLLYANAGNTVDFSVAGEDNIKLMDKQKSKIDKNNLIIALRIMMETTERLKFSEGQKFLLEMGFLELVELFKPATKTEKAKQQKSDFEPRPKESTDKAERSEAREVLWHRILAAVKDKKIPTHALLSQGRLLGAKDDEVYIGFKKGYKFHKERMEEKGNRDILEEVLNELFDRYIEVQFVFLDDDQYNDIIVQKAIEFFGEEIVEIKD